jgi:hypothetical protein
MFETNIVSKKMKQIIMFMVLFTMSFTVVQAQYPTTTGSTTTATPTGIIMDTAKQSTTPTSGKKTATAEQDAAWKAASAEARAKATIDIVNGATPEQAIENATKYDQEAKAAEAAKEAARIANATVFSKLITSFGGLVFDGVVKINGAIVVIFLALSVISVYISMIFTPGASIEGIFSMILKRGINVTITTTIIAGWTVLIPESLIIWLKLGNIFGSGDNFKAEPGQGINGALTGAGSFLDEVWAEGTAATNTLFATSKDLKNLLLILLIYFMIVILFFAYIYILTMITLAMLEYIFIGGLSIILLAFEGSEALKSISRKVINTILALGVKVLVTVAISTMAVREMGEVPIELLTPKDPDVLGVLTWVAKCLLLAYCCINLPKLVTSLLHGNGEAFSIQSLSKFAGSVGKAAAGGGGALLGAAGGALDGAMAGSEAAKLKGENPILGGLGGGAKGGMQKTYDASNSIARFKQDPLGSIFRKNADSPDKQQKLNDRQKLDRLKAVEDKFGKDSPEWKEKAVELFGKTAVGDGTSGTGINVKNGSTIDAGNAKDYTKDTTKDHSGDREKDTTKDHSGDREQKILKNAENMGEAGTGKSNGSNKSYDDLTKKPDSKNIGGKSDEKEYRQYSQGVTTSTTGTSEKLSSLQRENVDKDTSPKSNDSSTTKDYTNKGDSLSSSSTQSSSSSDSKNTERESTITKNDYSKLESPNNSSSDARSTNRETTVTKNEYHKAVAIEEKGAWNPSKSDRADKTELSKLKAAEDKNAWKDK